MKTPKGYKLDLKSGPKVCISVRFSPETFKRLCKRSQKLEMLFSDVVEDVARCGLLCIEESERDEREQEEVVVHGQA